ncbi:MAG TPA: hypothetical protein VMM58_08725 [Bacteroidota bacterium]|nr:hypothetical protein [Bacteroidota bacterium]
MKKTKLAVLILMIAFVWAVKSPAQQYITVIPTVTSADIVNATALVDPLTEQVKNISPSSFSLNIINNTSSTHGKDTVWVNMHIEAYVTLDEDGPPAKQLVTADTRRPFPVPPAGRIFTSLDAQTGHSSDIDINSDVNQTMKQRLKDEISDASSGGKAPSGIYQVKIILYVVQVGSQMIVPNQIVDLSNDPRFTVSVTNPTNATLLQPSDNGVEYPSPFPQFQWTYDTRGVKISVYEKRPEQQSLEDAISASDPFWVVNINRKASGNLSIITYPQAAISGPGINQPEDNQAFGSPLPRDPRPLERGKSYVVVLDGIRTAFGYNIDPLRTIRLFRISDPQGNMIMNILQSALSGGTYQNFLNIIQDQKLQVNSSHMTLNGVSLSGQELQIILNQNKNSIKSIRFEDQ